MTSAKDSGVYLLVSDEERNELPNLVSEGVPRNPILGDGTLLYRSMDCLKNNKKNDVVSILTFLLLKTDIVVNK